MLWILRYFSNVICKTFWKNSQLMMDKVQTKDIRNIIWPKTSRNWNHTWGCIQNTKYISGKISMWCNSQDTLKSHSGKAFSSPSYSVLAREEWRSGERPLTSTVGAVRYSHITYHCNEFIKILPTIDQNNWNQSKITVVLIDTLRSSVTCSTKTGLFRMYEDW